MGGKSLLAVFERDEALTFLGRVIRDIERKFPEQDEAMVELLEISRRIHHQQRQDKGKVYSVHATEVECISKGQAHK